MNIRSDAEDHDSPIEGTLAERIARQIQDAVVNIPVPRGSCIVTIEDDRAVAAIAQVLERELPGPYVSWDQYERLQAEHTRLWGLFNDVSKYREAANELLCTIRGAFRRWENGEPLPHDERGE